MLSKASERVDATHGLLSCEIMSAATGVGMAYKNPGSIFNKLVKKLQKTASPAKSHQVPAKQRGGQPNGNHRRSAQSKQRKPAEANTSNPYQRPKHR